MLNQVEKNKILNSIKNSTINKNIRSEIESKRWNLNKCSDVLDFLITEIEKKLDLKKKKPTKTLSNLIYSLCVTFFTIIYSNDKILISEDGYNKILNLRDLYKNNISTVDPTDVNRLNELCKILNNNKNNVKFIWLTTGRAMFRFIKAIFGKKNNYFN